MIYLICTTVICIISQYKAVVLHTFDLLADVKVHIFLNLTLHGDKWSGFCSSYFIARGKDTQYPQDRRIGRLYR
jgi:hypothetical protein